MVVFSIGWVKGKRGAGFVFSTKGVVCGFESFLCAEWGDGYMGIMRGVC